MVQFRHWTTEFQRHRVYDHRKPSSLNKVWLMTELVYCPHCNELIRQAAILCRFCQRGLSAKHFKNCPRCHEMIRPFARKCRFCGTNLEVSSSLPNEKADNSQVSGHDGRTSDSSPTVSKEEREVDARVQTLSADNQRSGDKS